MDNKTKIQYKLFGSGLTAIASILALLSLLGGAPGGTLIGLVIVGFGIFIFFLPEITAKN